MSLSSAKLSRPRLQGVYPVPRLHEALDQALSHPILWLSGEAGAGKTTLVLSYLEARAVPSLYYKLDAGDGDAASFFCHLGALARPLLRRSRAALPMLSPEYASSLPAFAQRFFQQLYGRLPPRSLLVLDDYQDLPPESATHEVIRLALEALPPGAGAILMSRGDVAPPLLRELVRGRLAVIGGAELRLSPAESEGLLRSRDGTLSAEAAARLHALSGGWAAGLVLLLEWTRRQGRLPSDVGPGGAEQVFDYLAAEVFERLPPAERPFLLITALLPHLTPELAERLTGNAQAGRLLAALHRHNFFTERHDGDAPVYRYHRLFRAFLLDRAAATLPQEELRAHRERGARLLLEANLVEDAVPLLAASSGWERLAAAILERAPLLVSQGRSDTLAGWIALLPEALLAESGWLRYWQGLCLLLRSPAESPPVFEAAFAIFERQGDELGRRLACAGALQSILLRWSSLGELDRWIDAALALEARSDAAAMPPPMESAIASALAMALVLRRPGHPERRRLVARALELGTRAGGVSWLATGGNLGIHCSLLGAWEQAELAFRSVEEVARRCGPDAPERALGQLSLHLVATYRAYAGGDCARCLAAAAAGLEHVAALGLRIWNVPFRAFAANAALDAGDLAAARQQLDAIGALTSDGDLYAQQQYHALSARLALCCDDSDEAQPHAERALQLAAALGVPFIECVARFTVALVALRRGDAAPAQRALAAGAAAQRAIDSPWLAQVAALLEAELQLRAGDERGGDDALARALGTGRAQRLGTTFLWEPRGLSRLLARALSAGIEGPYARELIRRRRLPFPGPSPRGEERGGDAGLGAPELWPWPLRLTALGGLEIVGPEGDGAQRPSRGPLRLLIALVAAGGREVPQEELADVLWQDAEGDAARRSFDTTLHRLRRLLAGVAGLDDGGAALLVLQGGRLSLNRALCWLDLWTLEGALDLAQAPRRRLAGSDAPRGAAPPAEVGRRLLRLYRGPLLAGESWHPSLLRARERLHERVLRGVAACGEELERARSLDEALALYQGGLALDGLHEPFCQRLMRCAAALGRDGEALAAYERLRQQRLATRGGEVSRETTALYREILARVRG